MAPRQRGGGSEPPPGKAVGVRGHRVRDREHAEAQRHAILMAAAEVFGEKGYRAAKVEEIAARLEVSKPVIYYYFRNKEDLYVEVRVAGTLAGCQRLEQMVAEHEAPVAILRATARDLVEGLFDPLNRAATLIDFGDALSREGVRRIREAQSRYRSLLRDVIEQGIAEGVLAQGDAHVMALVFMDAVHSVANWYRPGGRLSRAQVVDEVVERAMGTLLPTRDLTFRSES
jgi:AcrR family transcriptional regulator